MELHALLKQKALREGGEREREMDKEIKAKLKQDKARLKELRKLNKQNALSVDETWEYVRLMNESTERIWKQVEKLEKVTFIFLGSAAVMEIVTLILTVLRALKH